MPNWKMILITLLVVILFIPTTATQSVECIPPKYTAEKLYQYNVESLMESIDILLAVTPANTKVKEEDKRIIASRVYLESLEKNLDPKLVLSIIKLESNFKIRAISSAGARGLMQIMSMWVKKDNLNREALFLPEYNIRKGTYILVYYLEQNENNMTRALADYNGNVSSNRYPNKIYRIYAELLWKERNNLPLYG